MIVEAHCWPGFICLVNRARMETRTRFYSFGSYKQARRSEVMDWLILLGVLALWWGLQLWILPRLGVAT